MRLGEVNSSASRHHESAGHRPEPSGDDAEVLEAIGWSPVSLDALAARTARPLGALALALDRLRGDGWLSERGGWYERIARSDR
jgi:predicted Rossmann fold nucleotide-binding protein DprA/Smf involved in DNA uptake